jgi:hypothetical protein
MVDASTTRRVFSFTLKRGVVRIQIISGIDAIRESVM